MAIWMQAPPGCSEAGVADRTYQIGDDQLVEVDEAHVEALKGHGFVIPTPQALPGAEEDGEGATAGRRRRRSKGAGGE